MYEAVVVGASVVGGVCAKELAQRGVQTLLLSDKIGKDGKCTSIVSKNGLVRTGISYEDAVLHEIYGARVWAGNTYLSIPTSHVQALVLDRFKLDELSVGQAQDAGAELRIARFDGQFASTVLIGADGVASTVAHTQGFSPLEKIVTAWEGEFDNASLDNPSLVDVFLCFPGLFAWAVPCGEDSVRVGLAVEKDLQEHKKSFLALQPVSKMLCSATKKREFYHAIPLRYRKQTQKNNVLLVGDAAGQVKATTGGGIVFGSLCAKEAAEQTRFFLDGGELNYENAWRKKYAKTLNSHLWLRRILNATPMPLASVGLSVLSALNFNSFLEKHGDMDFVLKPSTI